MLKHTKLFFISILIFFCSAEARQSITIHTLPKSGTHLLKSVLDQLPHPHLIFHVTDPLGNPIYMHKRRVVNIRDLRDYFVSLRHWANKAVEMGLKDKKNRPAFKPVDRYQKWLAMTPDEQLIALITLNENIPCWENVILNSILETDKQIKEAEFNSNILITKFESWIGERGGGSFEAFASTLKKCLNHFGYEISDKKLNKVYKNFYGHSITFDQGKIGRWKDEFKEEHIMAFKEIWNDFLIDWGYESCEDW